MNECGVARYGRGTNGTVVFLGRLTVWFSYKTPVAFQVGGNPRVVRDNTWGPTTGAHLNEIDGGNKAARIPGEAFEARLSAAMQA